MGARHPLPNLSGCTGTRGTRSNEDLEINFLFFLPIDELQGQNTALIQQLAMEQNSAQILKGRQDEEVYQLKDEIVSLKKALDEEASSTKDHETYLNLKLTEIANLHKEINAYKESNNENLEKIQKLETGLDALAQVSEEQNTDRISISKELKKKNLMYDRLLTEYESAKAKVRVNCHSFSYDNY